MRKLLLPLLPVLFFAIAYLLPLDGRDLVRPDETRYAEIPREMLASGHWITPKLDGVRYFEKPPLGYWLTALSQQYLGESNFAVRLPSAVATGAAAGVLFLVSFAALGRSRREQKVRLSWRQRRAAKKAAKREAKRAAKEAKKRGKQESPTLTPAEPPTPPAPLSQLAIASLAALIYLGCSGVFVIGTTAVLDAIFTLFVTGSIASFYGATGVRRGSLMEWLLLLLAGLFCGAAFLTKGFPALALPMLVLVPWLLWQRRFVDIFRMAWLPLLVAGALCLPWVLQIHWWEKEFWNFFIVNEHLRRFMGEDAQHAAPAWFFVLKAPLLLLPWLAMVPAAFAGLLLRQQEEKREVSAEGRLVRFCCVWALLPFLFFSAASGKLLTYILPCVPPVALLLAVGLGRLFNGDEGRELFQLGTTLTALSALVALGGLLYVQIFGVEGLRHLTLVPGGTPLYAHAWQAALAGGGLLFLLLCLARARHGGRTGLARVFAYGCAPLVLYAVSPWLVPDSVAEARMPGPLLERYAHRIAADDIVISGESCLRAVCWYWKRTDVHAVEWAGELEYGFGREDSALAHGTRILTLKEIRRLARKYPNRIVMVIRSVYKKQWKNRLPKPLFVASSGEDGFTIMRL